MGMLEIVVPTSKMEDSVRYRHKIEGGIEFHGVEFDEVGEEMIFHFITDDDLDDLEMSEEFSEDIL